MPAVVTKPPLALQDRVCGRERKWVSTVYLELLMAMCLALQTWRTLTEDREIYCICVEVPDNLHIPSFQ